MDILRLPQYIILLCIRAYQHTLSPDHGPLKHLFPYGYCKYNPTCSEYAYEAIKKYGIVKGGAMGAYRILRCNPFTNGGDDPVS